MHYLWPTSTINITIKHINKWNKFNMQFPFYLMIAAQPQNGQFHRGCNEKCSDPSTVMATASKPSKVDNEGRRFQERWKLQYFFIENWNNCVCLICHETVALFKEYNVKRHDETKHAKAYNMLPESDLAEKVKELQASLTTQQWFFTQAHKWNENITKASSLKCRSRVLKSFSK